MMGGHRARRTEHRLAAAVAHFVLRGRATLRRTDECREARLWYGCRVMRKLWTLLRDTGKEFVAEDPFTMAGALSYYTLLSIAPLLLMIVSVAGLVYGEDAARGQVVATFESMIGSEAAGFVQEVLAKAHQSGSGWLSAVVAGVGLLVGATTAFAQLQSALGKIWGVKGSSKAVVALLRGRLLGFLVVVTMGFTVIVSLIASSVLSALASHTHGEAWGWIWRLADFGVPLVLMTGLFAVIFRVLPDAVIRWREVWIGAAITSLLFAVGRVAIGIYIGRSGVASASGAAGSVIGLLIFVYYASVIVLFGAEITQVDARTHGEAIVGKYQEPATDAKAARLSAPAAGAVVHE
jgi:membrane protein